MVECVGSQKYNILTSNILIFFVMPSHRYKGFYEYAKSKGIDVGKAVGLEVVVDGIVPTGISSHECLTKTELLIKKRIVNNVVANI